LRNGGMVASFQLRGCENWVFIRADRREKTPEFLSKVLLVTPYEMNSVAEDEGEEHKCIQGFGRQTWRKETTCKN
jgi:hypothetical protein